MIYETAVVAYADLDDVKRQSVLNVVKEVLEAAEGKILLQDDWGVRVFAQPTGRGVTRGQYYYFMYQAGPDVNKEIERRLRINDHVIKSLIVSLGKDNDAGQLVKDYRSPFAQAR